MATNQANIKAVITAEDKASSVLKGFSGNVDKTSKSVTDSISTSAVAIGLATAGIVAFGKKSLDAFNQQDLAVTRLKTGILNVRSATDKNVDGLIQQAAALQKVTRFSDEQIISAQGILTTFQLNQKAITAITPRLLDMSEGLARVSGQMPDLEGNAMLVAKALGGEDVEGLLTVLRRNGVQFTKFQQEILKTGTFEERLSTITQVLDQNYANLATGAGSTTAGKMAELGNQFNDLQEKIGSLIANALTPFLNVMNAHPAVLTATTVALGALATAFVAVKVAGAVGTVIQGATTAITALGAASTGTIAALGGLNATLLAFGGWGAFAAAAFIAFNQIQNAINDIKNNLNLAQKGAMDLGNAQDAFYKSLAKARDEGRITQDEYLRRSKAYSNSIQIPARAMGGPVASGASYMVGERGPEVFTPNQNGSIIPNGGGGSVNITLSVGALMGNDVEARRFAKVIVDNIKDLAGAKNMTPAQWMNR